MKSDGTIIIDTEISTDGISRGIKSLEGELGKGVDGIAKVGSDAGQEFVDNFDDSLSGLGDPVNEQTDNIQDKLGRISSSMTKLGGALSLTVTAPLTALGGKMIEASAEMNAMSSQFSQVFGTLEGDAASSLSKIADDTGIVEERLKGSYTSIAAFAKTTGLETADALELSNRAMVAVADSAAFYDRSLEDTAESLRSFLKGNYENDAALGLSATEFTRNAAANELYGKSFNDLSEAQKQLTLLKMVEDANALSGALGQASRESDTWSNVTGNLNQEFTNLLATLGQNLLPVVTPIVQFISDLLQKFSEMDPAIQKIIVIVGAVAAALGPVLTSVGGIVSAVNTLLPVVSAVAGALGPIPIAIGAVVAAIALLIANWDAVKDTMQRFDDWLTNIFSQDWTKVFGALGEPINAFMKTAKDVWEGIKTVFNGIITFVKGVFSGNWKQAWEGVKQIFSGIWESVKAVVKAPINGIIGLINGLISAVVSGLNSVIDRLNSIHFSIPDWVPFFGGNTFGLNLSRLTAPKIPYLAQGAVIPPNAPFMAMLGDQRNGNNLEMPESLLRRIVREETGGRGGTYRFVGQINRRVLFDEMITEAKMRQAMNGQNPFEMA